MNAEPTIQDVLDAMNIFSTHVDQRFNDIDKRFDEVDKRLELNDQAHAEMLSNFGLTVRKSNTKLTVLVDSLVSEKSLDSKTAQRILALEPFAQGAQVHEHRSHF